MNEIIKHYESLHDGDLRQIGLQPKMDPVGIWTEGWGHAMLCNGKFIKGAEKKSIAYSLSKIHTLIDAETQLLVDLQPIDLLIARKIKVELSTAQRTALQSFFYNCGFSNTLVSMINDKHSLLYDWWCTHYITGEGVKLPGLVYRRKTEATLFTTGQLIFFNF